MGNIAVAHMTLSSYSRKRASQDVERRLQQAVPHWVHKGWVFSAGCAALQFEDSICQQLEQLQRWGLQLDLDPSVSSE